MTRATNSDGSLADLDCSIEIPIYPAPFNVIPLNVLPEITDSKSANYANEPIIGRTQPLTTYGYSEPRTLNTELTFVVTKSADIKNNLLYLRIIESLVYPGPRLGSAPYQPPPVCHIHCGLILGDTGLCVVLKSYSVRFPTDVAWDSITFLPYKFSVSCTWEVVYDCTSLPTNDIIRQCSYCLTS